MTSGRPLAPMRELDLLRGLAIVMMVINHAGVRFVARPLVESGALGALIFWGSFAPVVFFFTTGVGVSLARRSGRAWADIGSSAAKAALLLVADQIAYWATGRHWGLDFLGFIAISSVCITVVAATPRPMLLSAGLVLLLTGLRYVLGAAYWPHFEHPGLWAWFVGTTAVPNVSYAAAPWLIYPLVGFMLARVYLHAALTDAGVRRWALRALLVGVVFGAAAYAMGRSGVVFYRWGVVSSGYFVLSFGVLMGMVAVAMWLKTWQPWTVELLGLRGAASLAVVPIHMALIVILERTLPRLLGAWEFLAVGGLLVIVSLGLAVHFATWTERRSGRRASMLSWGALVLSLLACVVAQVDALPWSVNATLVITVGQLAVAALLAFRNSRRAAARAENISQRTGRVP